MPSLKLSEIFFSVQGEGSRSGLPCVFVRMQGCGLRCRWCDTPYALDHKQGGDVADLDDILARVAHYGCRFIELTGGEPLEQEASFALVTRLCDEGYEVAIETGGHVDISEVDPRAIVIMDLKCPGSAMARKNRWSNIEYLKPGDEVKFVIADREDFDWACAMLREHRIHERVGTVLFSPVFGELANVDLVRWILDERVPARFQLQQHKYIWAPDTRGV